MAEACQWAVAAFKVSRAHVIENQGTFGQMSSGESIFDALLALEQPVQRVIELGFIDCLFQPEQGSQGGGGGFRMESAGRGEFGSGFENAGADHGNREITLGSA